MNYDCNIDCKTLKCTECNKSAASCNIRRNCSKYKIQEYYKSKETFEKNGPTGGPGTQLKKLLNKFGIKEKNSCKCADRSKYIDYMEKQEPGWTSKNIETIVDWMQEEAKKRNIPFLRVSAKLLVKLAIRNSLK